MQMIRERAVRFVIKYSLSDYDTLCWNVYKFIWHESIIPVIIHNAHIYEIPYQSMLKFCKLGIFHNTCKQMAGLLIPLLIMSAYTLI